MSDRTHSHVFLGTAHSEAERRTWAVIALCTVMMLVEIIGGSLYGSIALVADGLHMSTHAGALLLAALAYRFARTRVGDPRFAFGTGKFGDLAGYTSAIVLALIAALIAFEALRRFLQPVPIHFREAIPIAALGLIVNLASAWLLIGGEHAHHHHGHGHDHGHDAAVPVLTVAGLVRLEIFEDGEAPVFRLSGPPGALDPDTLTLETERPGGSRQDFAFIRIPGGLQSIETVPEPHEFIARLALGGVAAAPVPFREAAHAGAGATHRDNNLRAAMVHVLADAAVSLMVIGGLSAAALFGWTWMDPLAGLIGAAVILSWAWTLVRDTGAILLDMSADPRLVAAIRTLVAEEGDRLADLHLWRLGPGHLGAILAVETSGPHDAQHYHRLLATIPTLSHLTVEIRAAA